MGLVIVYLFSLWNWKPSAGLWSLAALLNTPTCIVLFSTVAGNDPNHSSWAIIATLVMFFWGTAGLGLALLLWLLRGTFTQRRAESPANLTN
ncbi:hypothetical protein [Bradyrhizobium septentrionale]|uniref:Uncharacterized protein n=1 Tax=Bradyrhizobium septentrionale TaxID=1404411 RepID=A0A973VVI4_9BRAD|nr:hypothetical protein [Bradyrhizobium septentrionale]UGY19662.1 hypothetical protein HAP48_0020725 [Bradyrhizobium septentrionale]UGY28450.1 hypothetical protein HU675_0017735 [Bradyrhizobium septentrionale]